MLSQLTRLQKSEDAKIIYAAEETPIFHSFFPKELAAFKLFYWQRSVLNVAEYQTKKFDFDVIPEKQIQRYQETITAFNEFTELYTENSKFMSNAKDIKQKAVTELNKINK